MTNGGQSQQKEWMTTYLRTFRPSTARGLRYRKCPAVAVAMLDKQNCGSGPRRPLSTRVAPIVAGMNGSLVNTAAIPARRRLVQVGTSKESNPASCPIYG